MRVPPTHTFAQQNAADLAAFDHDARLFACLSESIQTPLSCSLLITGNHLIRLPLQPPRRSLAHQSNELTIISHPQSAGATGFRSVSQPFDPFCIETMESAAHGLWATVQIFGNRFHSRAIPTVHDDLCMKNPVSWSVPAGGQLVHPSFFFLILC